MMQFDLSQEEVQALLYAISMYRAHLKEEAEELAEPYYRSEIFLTRLKDKLKQFQMQFPLEEHDPKHCKVFGYEKAKLDETEAYTEIAHDIISDTELLRLVDKSIWRNIT